MLSSYYTTTFNDSVNFGRLAISRLTAGIGLALFLPPLFRLTINVHPEKNDSILLFRAMHIRQELVRPCTPYYGSVGRFSIMKDMVNFLIHLLLKVMLCSSNQPESLKAEKIIKLNEILIVRNPPHLFTTVL